jgi:hypothetical protein
MDQGVVVGEAIEEEDKLIGASDSPHTVDNKQDMEVEWLFVVTVEIDIHICHGVTTY